MSGADPADGSGSAMASRRSRVGGAIALGTGFLLTLFGLIIAIAIAMALVGGKELSAMDLSEKALLAVGVLAALMSFIMGGRVMIRGASSPSVVIPPEDRQLLECLIKNANEKGIDQYVRLSSLSGATGTATKLGLTGLPLATVGLTIFFAVIGYFHPDGFMDLTKLTLGAFIGSFVQRNVSGERTQRERSDQPQ